MAASGIGAIAPFDPKLERRITTMLGTAERSISVSRVIRATPKETLQLIGRVFTAQPYLLTVKETINGHPLDGGVLRFEIPNLYTAISSGHVSGMVGKTHGLIYQVSGILEVSVLNVTLKARGTAERPECEVVVTADLRDGQRKNLKGTYYTAAGSAVGLGGGALAIAAKVLGSVALATPVGAGMAVLTALGSAAAYRAYFRRSLGRARGEIDKMLHALQQTLDRETLFGGPVPAPVRLPGAGDADAATFITLIT